MDNKEQEFDAALLEKMNEKFIRNQFFTPDNIYMELGLFKDFNIGALFAKYAILEENEEQFNTVQKYILSIIRDYQARRYDTIDPFFKEIGFTDDDVDAILSDKSIHDKILVMSPTTYFIETLVKHLYRNQNNSRPAGKYTKRKIDDAHFTMDPVDVTFRINTYPLTLSDDALELMGKEFGEAFGVNIIFINKDPHTFDKTDWDTWLKDVDCFYFDSLGRFTSGDFIYEIQSNLGLMGKWVFARKRFEKQYMLPMQFDNFENAVAEVTTQLDIHCDFAWLQNNEVRLTEEREDVPMNDDIFSSDIDKDSETNP